MARRTIDNLGVDVSNRYAQDQEFLDENILKEARRIVPQTQIDVTQPAYPSEFDALFDCLKEIFPGQILSLPFDSMSKKKGYSHIN